MNRPFISTALFIGVAAAWLASAPISHAKYTSATPPTSGPTIPGDKAAIDPKTGIAYAPANAPECVKRAIWATNYLRKKPYVWGGGHGSFYVDGYDCSATVSFLLRHAGRLDRPTVSGAFRSYGNSGKGRWITVYAKDGHVYAVVAGLRLDTTDMDRFTSGEGPRWRMSARNPSGFVARHPEGL
jgi:hypothetical protein